MNNQNQSAVEYLEQFLRRHCNPTVCDIEYSEYKMAFEQAKEMESKKQHKYNEMLDMLNRIRLGELPEEELRQLIKEATILP
jgi:hypothetical protein